MTQCFSRACLRALVACAASTSLSSAQTAPASPPAESSSGTRVAVIDIAKVFEAHPGFKQSMDKLKQDVQAVENQMRQRRQQLESIRERMKQFETGSPEYKDLESQYLKIQADGQIEATQKKKEFIEREASVYYTVYKEIEAEVSTFARVNRISMVVRFNSSEIDPKDQQSILEGVNRPLVFSAGNINITEFIKEQISRSYAKSSANATAAGSRPAQTR